MKHEVLITIRIEVELGELDELDKGAAIEWVASLGDELTERCEREDWVRCAIVDSVEEPSRG